MRSTALAILLAISGLARAALVDELLQDPQKKGTVAEGMRLLQQYFSEDQKYVEKGQSAALDKRDKAMESFRAWLAKTPESLGVDLAAKTDDFLDLLDRARVVALPKTLRPGLIEYFAKESGSGYALRVPKGYKHEGPRIPLVLTLHGRVINANHPAFKGDSKRFVERGRAPIHDYWLDSPAADEVVVVAPTTVPTGFDFQSRYFEDLRALFVNGIEAGMSNCRVDWNRMFLEVQGPAMRVVCEHPSLFAGYIVRDGEIPPEQYFMFENLNGVPLCYVADEKRWTSVGLPLTTALQAAYAAAGVPENLVVYRAMRDANDALKGDPAKVAQFLRSTGRPKRPDPLRWRFFRDSMLSPMPIDIDRGNFVYVPGTPLDQAAGKLVMKVTRGTFMDGDAEKPLTTVTIDVTESEGLKLYLHDGLAPLDEPMTIVVNGTVLHERVRFKRDPEYFITWSLPRRYFMLPYMGEVKLRFPLKPQFEAPKAPPPEAPPAPPGGQPGGPQDGQPTGDKPGDKDKPAGDPKPGR